MIKVFPIVPSLLLLSACIIMVFLLIRSRKSKKQPVQDIAAPFAEPLVLGIRNGLSIRSAVLFLEKSYKEYYGDILEKHVMAKYGWSTEQFRITLFELKRYFILISICKLTTIRGGRPGLLWKEMLDLDDRYDGFMRAFCRRSIPFPSQSNTTLDFHEHAMFDWLYFTFFEPTDHSAKEWGGFHRYSFDQQILLNYKQMSHSTLLITLFHMESINHMPGVEQAAHHLLAILRSHLHTSGHDKDKLKRSGSAKTTFTRSEGGDIFPVLYTSYRDSEHRKKTPSDTGPSEVEMNTNDHSSHSLNQDCSSDSGTGDSSSDGGGGGD